MRAEQLRVYLIMGSVNSPMPLQTLEQALAAGITCFQLREKGDGCLTDAAYESFARACQTLCATYDVPFIVNDDVDLAQKLRADGVHIGQGDAALKEVRKRMPDAIIGISVHHEAELAAAVADGADYVGIGPIYATTSKPDAQPPAGLAFLRNARKLYPTLPIVGIGGIDQTNATAVRAAGADGVAVISAICASEDVGETVAKLSGK